MQYTKNWENVTLFQGKRQPTKTNPQLVQIQEFANKDFKENIFIVNEKIGNVSKYRNDFNGIEIQKYNI